MCNSTSNNNLLQFVTFKLAKEYFAVEIVKVQEIIHMQPITKVPNVPDFIEGIINLRGKVIPVVDLRTRFQIQNTEFTEQTRIIVMDLKGQIIGFIVDAVYEVLRIHESTVEAPPAIFNQISEYISGMAKLENRLLILLNLDELLTDEYIEKISF